MAALWGTFWCWEGVEPNDKGFLDCCGTPCDSERDVQGGFRWRCRYEADLGELGNINILVIDSARKAYQ